MLPLDPEVSAEIRGQTELAIDMLTTWLRDSNVLDQTITVSRLTLANFPDLLKQLLQEISDRDDEIALLESEKILE